MNLDPTTALVMGFVVPVVMMLLNRIFGGGDQLRAQVHALALAMKDTEAKIRDHSDTQYATKEDIKRLEKTIEGLDRSMQNYTDAVTTVLGPIANQLGLNAVRK